MMPLFACAVMHNLALEGLLDGGLKFRPMTLPDRFIEHGGQADQLAEAGLSASHIAATALTLLGRRKDSVGAAGERLDRPRLSAPCLQRVSSCSWGARGTA